MPNDTRQPKVVLDRPAAVVSRNLIPITEAARSCGWKRANTFREQFLATEEEAIAMGLTYDERGRAVVDAAAVAAAVATVEAKRAIRGVDWRIKNLKRHAKARPTQRQAKPKLRRCQKAQSIGEPRRDERGT